VSGEITILNDKVVITHLVRAQKVFDEAVAGAKTQLERDGAIHQVLPLKNKNGRTMRAVF
jgi:hypothetical protein